jgi:hypothetical protein
MYLARFSYEVVPARGVVVGLLLSALLWVFVGLAVIL